MSTPRPRHAADDLEVAHPSVGTLVKEASTHFSTLIRSELELAKTEVKAEVKKGVTGSGLLAAAGAVAALSIPFFFVVLAEGLVAIGLPRWLAYLIVFVLFMLIAGVLAMIGLKKVKKVRAPERTIDSMKRNKELVDAVKSPDEPLGKHSLPRR
ncbi:phage holin family protein [Cumulibacter manganitolerans]|uniref:phage holin family protein n=1 Tax=Cumulibacter manganitolerans TaxID=1884992 RepID=UPI001295AB41|nr:phage holin family protein [Cumulibacter manganitolerans]